MFLTTMFESRGKRDGMNPNHTKNNNGPPKVIAGSRLREQIEKQFNKKKIQKKKKRAHEIG